MCSSDLTVILFRKTERSRILFDMVGAIQRNYNYYRLLYNIREGNYRNDYAFAIANIIASGYSINESQGIPWKMFTITSKIESMELNGAFINVKCEKAVVLPKQNIHIMDKEFLQSDQFGLLVEKICE